MAHGGNADQISPMSWFLVISHETDGPQSQSFFLNHSGPSKYYDIEDYDMLLYSYRRYLHLRGTYIKV